MSDKTKKKTFFSSCLKILPFENRGRQSAGLVDRQTDRLGCSFTPCTIAKND